MNIPFALLSSVLLLWAAGQTINIMTLGGLALAVGVLVDEATVEIENIHIRMLPGVTRARAVVEACSRTALARLLSMTCILAVFLPSFFMVGVGRQLFVPLSLAVGFSMIASYLLSSSLVPVFSTWMRREAHRGEEHEGLFGRLRSFYERYLGLVLRFRWLWRWSIWPRLSACSIFCSRIWAPSCFRMPIPPCCASACALPPARASRRPNGFSGKWKT
jgi:multidrug efflux pump subunit AcrB